ncbi:hypothetical protein M409DRAFT_26650 [Zasmidium cellare ATCC 36951]|uniref:DNA replication complex GINS protein PSF3 n=1 Tax=Zasmidium cellare ATCC 36951 TaxID=1080233 RepID=A0A6A6C6Y3_ZASCE|nr:uncharacterized protein M409DRAFT_26650 [Zasmidium cellare ATCC 36951]KAF2162795.1 hypothetical protein M409DRAFT_26650 [Zasmidium cellare ATCC 36951]
MATSYYSVDAILTDSQKAPCTFDLSVPHLTALNNGSGIENGMKLELPLWMADMLALSKPAGPSSSSLVSLDMPAALGPRVINALKADPKSVDVKAQARWFYGLGERMLDLFDEEEMMEVLNDTFKQRALEIADKAANTRTTQQGGDEFLRGLDENERRLFRAAHNGTNDVKKWFDSSSRA